MKTASLGLLEVPVVRVNAGGDAPPDPPSVGDVTGPFPLSLFSSKDFYNIFGEGVENYKKPHKTLTKKWRASIPEICPLAGLNSRN
jgi:hypothetical protein